MRPDTERANLTVIWCDRCGRVVNLNDETDDWHPEQCRGCRKYQKVDPDWGWCTNQESVYCGRITFEHDTRRKWVESQWSKSRTVGIAKSSHVRQGALDGRDHGAEVGQLRQRPPRPHAGRVRGALPPAIDAALERGEGFVVGDARGTDTMAQNYLLGKTSAVVVYHVFAAPRNNAGFPTVSGFESDEARDARMTADSDQDIAWMRPGRERSGTQKNLDRRKQQRQAKPGAAAERNDTPAF